MLRLLQCSFLQPEVFPVFPCVYFNTLNVIYANVSQHVAGGVFAGPV